MDLSLDRLRRACACGMVLALGATGCRALAPAELANPAAATPVAIKPVRPTAPAASAAPETSPSPPASGDAAAGEAAVDVPLPSGEVCDDTGAAADLLAGHAAAGMPTVAIPGLAGAGAIATSSLARAFEAPAGPTPTSGPTLPPGAFAQPRAAVLSFEARPTEVAPGGRVTLAWRAVGEAADLHTLTDAGRLSDPTPVALSGTLEAVVPAAERDVMRWVLMARAGDIRSSAEVKVSLTCPDTWFFAAPPADCPASAARADAMVAQRFERGWMLWSRDRDVIDVLFDEGERWAVYPDDWDPATPASDPAPGDPPPGRQVPVRGFARVWLTEPGVRDDLGWAVAPEVDLGQGRYQCDTNPRPVCYISGPDGAVFALQTGTWWAWEGSP